MSEDLRNKPKNGGAQGAQAAATPTATATGSTPDLAAIVEQQSKELAELRQMLMASIQSQPKVSPDTLWAKAHEKEMAIKEDLERHAAYFQEDCKKRTQWQANKTNPDGKKLFRVSIGWCPEIVVRANDTVTAIAYYQQACGIRSITPNYAKPATTEYAIAECTNDPEAQKLVSSDWEYVPAAA